MFSAAWLATLRTGQGMAKQAFLIASIVVVLASVAASPEDPHLPQCHNIPSLPFMPQPSQPCAWFEGWYTRIVDPTSGNSFAAIVGTINATGESMVTLLACYSSEAPKSCSKDGEAVSCGEADEAQRVLEEDEEKAEAAWKAVGGGSCGQLRIAQVIRKGATVTTHGHPVDKDPSSTTPPNMEWSLPGHGSIQITGEGTTLDLSLGDVSLKANLTNQKGWKEGDRAASPEGWVGTTASFLLPCRWYIHSLGSEATYVFTNGSVVKQGSGWGHEEKNWGKMFPDGHVWAQAMSKDNTVQVVLAVVYFKVFGITSPYAVSLGYRSPNLQQDFRNVDALTFVTQLEIAPCAGKINLLAHTLSHSIRLEISAPMETFGPKLLGPTGDAKWEALCQESFAATAQVGVWQRNDTWATRFSEGFSHGVLGKNKMIDRYDIHGAALEFGEGLLCENVAQEQLKKAAKRNAKTKMKKPKITSLKREEANFEETSMEETEVTLESIEDEERTTEKSDL